LDLEVHVVAGRERELALALRARLDTPRWAILAQIAAEVLAIHESAESGQRVVVVQARDPAAAVAALGLRSAG